MTAEEVHSIPLSSFSFEEVLSDYAKGFLEAAIDGEGCILLSTYHRSKYTGKVYYNPVLQIGNKSKEWLELVREIADDYGNINGKHGFYTYAMSWGGMRGVLPQLGLVVKEKQRVLILEALDILYKLRAYKGKYFKDSSFRGIAEKRLAEIAREIKELNHK